MKSVWFQRTWYVNPALSQDFDLPEEFFPNLEPEVQVQITIKIEVNQGNNDFFHFHA